MQGAQDNVARPFSKRTRLHPTHRQVGASRYLRPGGAWDVPTLDQLATSAASPAGTVIADATTRLTGERVVDTVARLAGGLRSAGVGPGDAVAWQLPNSVEAVLLFRACWRLGAVAVPLHHQLGETEVSAMLALIDPAITLARAGLPCAELAGSLSADPTTGDWAALLSAPPVRHGAAQGSGLAVALFTSGSTGEPKAVLHSHRSLAYKTLSMVAAHRLRTSDAVLMPAPLAHISGLLSGVLLPLAARMRTVLMERWDPQRAISWVEEERITFMIGPPVYFTTMAAAEGFTTSRMSPLRLISCGSMSISPDFVETTRDAFAATVKRTYGSTEAPTITTSAWDDPPDRARDTDGRVVGQGELQVVDRLTGRTVEAGRTGELQLRGPELFAGYADPSQTRVAMQNGWFRTGDLARLDGAGWLTIVGRTRDLIIRGGENVVPAEIEQVLESHPGVSQAVVVGYPDPHLGERVAACVVTTEPFGLAACREWCKERGVARFKTPDRVHRLDTLPTLTLGKPDRSALKAQILSLRASP